MQRLTTLRFQPRKLRAAREAKEITQSEAAASVGISKQALSKIELGKSAPTPNVLLRLCELVDRDLRSLSNRRAA